MSIFSGTTTEADADWGPFTGPWERYSGNPILGCGWGPGGVLRHRGKFWAFPTVPQVNTMLAVSDNGYDWKLAGERHVLTATEPWEGKYAGAKAALVTEYKVIVYYLDKEGIHERMGVATSTRLELDKTEWVKHPDNPVFGAEDLSQDVERLFPGSVVEDDANYYLFFDSGFDYHHPQYPRQYTIGVATSNDGIHFAELAANVVVPGPEGSWDSHSVCQAAVRKVGDWWYMIYSGFPSTPSAKQQLKDQQAFGLARAGKPGGPWEKYHGNPILAGTGKKGDFDSTFVQHACPMEIDGQWVLYYTGNDGNENVHPGARYQQGLALRKKG